MLIQGKVGAKAELPVRKRCCQRLAAESGAEGEGAISGGGRGVEEGFVPRSGLVQQVLEQVLDGTDCRVADMVIVPRSPSKQRLPESKLGERHLLNKGRVRNSTNSLRTSARKAQSPNWAATSQNGTEGALPVAGWTAMWLTTKLASDEVDEDVAAIALREEPLTRKSS